MNATTHNCNVLCDDGISFRNRIGKFTCCGCSHWLMNLGRHYRFVTSFSRPVRYESGMLPADANHSLTHDSPWFWDVVQRAICVIAATLCSAPFAALAIEDRADIEPNAPVTAERPIAWKLTPSSYRETVGGSALDINLRGNREDDVFWVGQYQRGGEFRQTRAGYEHQFVLPFGRLIASGQLASRGFAGASVTLELSRAKNAPLFALVGLGRTNAKPYYNLNFDPNDSTLTGVGWRPDSGNTVTLYQVRDDRLGTGQRVTHLVWRTQAGAQSQLTVDLFRRTGRADADPATDLFRANGIALTWDREPWFARLAYDPKANFTASDMTRLAIGVRF